ncbi:UDP-N-acetylmuramoyl-L-alanyl-D-glutamate--2, 6-diaminopimelate ligase [bacterium HR26]|nr:UDP-N-acetylmuramoyl-L-alanyl-D-glutamate--2, 6-diaminopimelate ligase [bacterium HR26]
MIPLRALLRALSVKRAAGDLDTPIAEVCYDSRQATPGALFVALRGSYTDGHRYLEDARRRGAVAALVEEWSDALDAYPAAAQVADTRAALARVAAEFFQHPSSSLGVIGVTGTDGKTTTTFLIDAMLRAAGYRTGLVGTVAVRIADRVVEHDTRQTTPESLDLQRLLAAMRGEGVQWAVVEATSHGLAMHRLDCCAFDIAVVTNITHEHLDFHGTIEAYRRAKARLLEFVAQRDDHRPYPYGIALNADDEGARSIAGYAGSAPVIWFGLHASQAEVRAQEIRAHAGGTDFELVTPGGSAPVRLKLLGRFNVENALAAATAGHLLGLTPQQIARGLESLDHVPGRLRRIDAGQPFTVIVDYAHTPEALQRILELVRGLVPGRLIAVFGSAGERDRAKRPLQGAVAARLAQFSIFTSEDPRFEDPERIIDEIAEGARSVGAVEGRDFLRIEDRAQAIREALRRAKPGDAVLLLGKGHERCIIYGSERRPWDESAEALAALAELGYRSEVE